MMGHAQTLRWPGPFGGVERGSPRGPTRRAAAVATRLVPLWFTAAFLARTVDAKRRQSIAAAFARRTLASLDVRLRVRNAPDDGSAPSLVVANHVSWLDVYVLNAVLPARFVAKSETESWPVVGTIVRRFDSLFIVRGSVRDAARVKDAVASALRDGDTVALFPEGTTTDGRTLRRFYPALFQAAVDAGVAVRPAAIRYHDAAGFPTTVPAFIDDMTFAGSLARVIRHAPLTADVTFGPPMSTSGVGRRELASRAQDVVARALQLPASRVEPAPVRRMRTAVAHASYPLAR